MIVLQWNARNLIANGQEFKGLVEKCKEKPDIICVQESWLKPNLDFVIKGYDGVRKDRKEGNGGGCVPFVKRGVQYRVVAIGKQLEYIVLEIGDWGGDLGALEW